MNSSLIITNLELDINIQGMSRRGFNHLHPVTPGPPITPAHPVTPPHNALVSSLQTYNESALLKTKTQAGQDYISQEQLQTKYECSETNQIQAVDQAINKLFAKNKVSAQNAFEIPLISINDLQSMKENSESSWNQISNTLENSSRIYGYRVDSITENISRMTSAMMRANHLQPTSSQQAEENSCDNKLVDRLCMENTQINYKKWLQIQHEYRLNATLQVRDNYEDMQMRRKFDQNKLDNLLLSCLMIGQKLELDFSGNKQCAVVDIFNNGAQAGQKMADSMQQPSIADQLKCDSSIINSATGLNLSIYSQVSTMKKILLDHQRGSCDILTEVEHDNQIDIDAMINCEQFRGNQKAQHYPFTGLYEHEHMHMHQQSNDQQYYVPGIPQHQTHTSNDCNKGRLPVKKQKTVRTKTRKKRVKEAPQIIDFISNDDKLCKKSIIAVTSAELLPRTKDISSHCKDKNLIMRSQQVHPINLKKCYLKQITEKTALAPLKRLQQEREHSFCMNSMSQICQISQLSQSCSNRASNIKANKQKLANILSTENELFTFEKVYHRYCADSNSNSEAICFVSILHLCNEMNLGLKSRGEFDFQIRQQ